MRAAARLATAALLLAGGSGLLAYPLDGYEDTGIRRVEGSRLATEGKALGGIQPPGALLTTDQVEIGMEMEMTTRTLYSDDENEYITWAWKPVQ